VAGSERTVGRGAGLALGVFAATIWGGQFILAKSAFAHVGPFEINVIRFVPVVLILAVLLGRVEGWDALRFDGRFRQLTAMAVAVAGFNLFNYVGLHYTRPQDASLIAGTTPLMAALVIWARTRVPPRKETVLLLVVALAGVVLVISHGSPQTYLHTPFQWGEVICALGAVSFAVYTLGAGDMPEISALRFTTLTSALGLVVMAGCAAVAAAVGYDKPPSAHELWLATPALVYLGLAGVVLGMLAWNASAQAIGGQNTALLANLIPVTVFAIQIVRGYRPAALELGGAAITLGAVTANNLLLRRRDAALVVATEER
jgi:drug/metabolite transporter (DMT)-like permease